MAGVKRNIQEMYHNGSSNGHAGNGNLNNHEINDNNPSGTLSNDAKKTRLDNHVKQEPSRVLHLRNIPQQLSENEIIYLGLSFGPIKNVLFLRSKNQAFLEFENLPEAQSMVQQFSNTPLTFSGKKIFVQYSNHQELNTDPNNSNNQHAQQVLSEALNLHQSAKLGGKNTVLRATIQNLMYPVTLDVLQQIFGKFGAVLKVITFNKNDKFQVLIQMKDSNCAQQARNNLNNQNIYNGCCTLHIDFSKLTTLEVRYNNDKSRDYTNLLLPSSQEGSNNQMNSGNNDININNGGMGGGHNGMSNMGYQNQSLIGNPPNLFAAVQAAASQMPFGNHNSNHHNNGNMNQGGGHQGGNQGGLNTPVLLVSNLNEELVTPDALFTLFGVYGDVNRVKILFNKKDSALINFSNAQQAATALQNLDRVKLWNKQIRVFPSKHLTVQMPKDGQPDAGLTKDFTNSPLHRFKKPGSKNFNNIFPPSQTLHLSNIPANVTEQELKDLFAAYGTVRGFKFFQKDRKMALIQMENAEEAMISLIATHNYQLADNMHLRVAFSKATI